jgi:hypothetical protein
MSWQSQQGQNLSVKNCVAQTVTTNSVTASNGTLAINGSSCNINCPAQIAGSAQINPANSNNAFLDICAVSGNLDYDVRVSAAYGNSATSGQGLLSISAAQGVSVNGPVTATNIVAPLINSFPPVVASGYGSSYTGSAYHVNCTPSLASPSAAATWTIANTFPCNGALIANSSAYSTETTLQSQGTVTENGYTFVQYFWTVELQGGGSSPQSNAGYISFVIF